MHGFLQVDTLLAETVVFATLHFEFVLHVLDGLPLNFELGLQVEALVVFLFEDLLDAVDFHLAQVNFVLVLRQL